MKSIEKSGAKKLVPTTVRLSKSAFSVLSDLSEKFGVSLGYTVRLAVELEYKKYCGSVRYIDREQASEILAAILKLTDICKEILNNIRHIGISYNQELHLKNAKKKYYEILKDSNASAEKRIAAKDIFDKEIAENQGTCLDKNKLKNILEQFEAAAEKAEVISWHIHE